ncbi:enoyl-CoA hydratase/isomerase family protein [Bordetella petrii]|uniref:enoyl-CoA hydratase/isomerase family protein n=1 Tax=Bordetella petrii TaxID=94624 RepID=UPI001E50D6EE|nr:enoyl-CoA hydratase-related protein [Bordetella petrii]MCD0502824.1 enoyl-CoA hydratase-related protein [Bordetella petrii]
MDMEAGLPELSINGKIATLALRRPDQANRLGPDDLAAIQAHIQAVNENEQVQVLRLQSAGKYFCSGYDIGKLGGERRVDFETVVNLLEHARPLTVAVIHGGVYGGGTDLALACDFRLGAHGVDMFMPAARLGLHFYRSGMERYVSRLGLNAAKRLFLAAERIDAAEMQRIGFLTHLAAADALPGLADELTATLTAMAPLAVIGMKKHLNRIARHELNADELSRDIARAANSEDLKEGRAAWLEKRPPRFQGR